MTRLRDLSDDALCECTACPCDAQVDRRGLDCIDCLDGHHAPVVRERHRGRS